MRRPPAPHEKGTGLGPSRLSGAMGSSALMNHVRGAELWALTALAASVAFLLAVVLR